MVLQDPPPGLPSHGGTSHGGANRASGDCGTDRAASANRTDCATSPRRPIQLRRWLRELAGRMEHPEEGVVLFQPRQGLP